MTSTRLPVHLALVMLALVSSGCGDDDDTHVHDASAIDAGASDAATTTPDAGSRTVQLVFRHKVGGAPVALGMDTPYTNAAGNQFGVTRVSYFVSDLVLTTMGGATVSAPGAHYVDHETPATHAVTLSASAGAQPLRSISFVMGLPTALNVTGAFTTPPESLMEWPVGLGGGYHFMKFEGRYVNSAATPFTFRIHSGALSGVDYSFPVTLDASGRSIGGADVTIEVVMNLEQWMTSPNTWDLNSYFNAAMPGIMNNAPAQASLEANGATVFTLGSP